MKYLCKKRPLAVAVASVIGMAGFVTNTAFAQSSDENLDIEALAIEEIVISAERRDTTASTTAISMEVLTGDMMSENQIFGFEDLQKAVPNLQFNTNGYGWAQANIRGVGNASGGGQNEQVGVPILFDGGTQGEEIGLGGGMFDVGTVQVLRGPQGTFIGSSAAGGAILVTSARPDFNGIGGYIEAQIGTADQEKVNGAVNLPISDTLAARIAFSSTSQGSHYINTAAGRSATTEDYSPGSFNESSYRIGLLWEPTENFTGYFKAESTKMNGTGATFTPSTRSYTGYNDHDNDPNTPSLPVTTYSSNAPGPNGEQYAPTEPFQLAHPEAIHTVQENYRYTMDLSYELNSGISLNSLTSYFDTNFSNAFGGNSRVTAPLFYSMAGPEIKTVSQEFTIVSPDDQRLDWLVGVSMSERHSDIDGGMDLNAAIFGPQSGCGWQYNGTWVTCDAAVIPPPSPTSWWYTTSDSDIKQQAVFAQLDFQMTDTIELTLGGRWNNDDNKSRNTSFWAGNPFAPPLDSTTGVMCPGVGGTLGQYCPANMRDFDAPDATWQEYEGDTPTYKAGINWEPSDNQFFYAFYARGYKAGQATNIDRTTGLVAAGTITVEPELVDDYEFGWKGTLFDGAIYAELGYFYQEYTDMQLNVYTTTATSSGAGIQNAGGSAIKGFEGSLRTNIGNLNINASFGYTESKIDGISTYEDRAFANLLPSSAGDAVGDSSKGCVTGASLQCFDFSPYRIELNDKQNVNSPELSYNISVDYPVILNNGATLTPRLSLNHADANYTDFRQVPGENYYTRDERDLLNLSVTYDVNDWSIQGFVNNISDETYVENAGDSIVYGEPRVMGLRLRMSF